MADLFNKNYKNDLNLEVSVTRNLQDYFENISKIKFNQFTNWVNSSLHDYPDLSTYFQVIHEQDLRLYSHKVKVLFFDEIKEIKLVDNKNSDNDNIIGYVQVFINENNLNCLAPIHKHPTCDVNYYGKEYELTNLSKMITSLVLNHTHNGYPRILPYVLVQDIMIEYVYKTESCQSQYVLEVLD